MNNKCRIYLLKLYNNIFDNNKLIEQVETCYNRLRI